MPKNIIVSESGLQNDEIVVLLNRLEKLNRLESIKTLTISDNLYKEIRTLGESLPMMAIIDTPNLPLNQVINTDCLIINGVQDNGNLGTLLRTASAIGFSTVICTTGTAQAYNPKPCEQVWGRILA